MQTRTTGAIILTATGNAQGGYYFLSLATGRKLSRQQWDALPVPMPDGVIAAVENMARAEQQPLIGQGAPLFKWSPRVEIQDLIEAPILQEQNDPVEVIEVEDQGAHGHLVLHLLCSKEETRRCPFQLGP
jgi:hypothetical protein